MADLITWLKSKIAANEHQALRKNMPLALHPYAEAIEATRKPLIAATVGSRPPPGHASSQLGGYPWWPTDRPLPTNKSGKPLFLLAQLNFSELPEFDPLPGKGLLQFFISSDDHYGADFDRPRSADGFACIFHESTDGPHRTDFNELKLGKEDYLPLEDPFQALGLTFAKTTMPVDVADYRFESLVPALAGAISDDDALFDAYGEWCRAAAIRLGGYPSFTQEDPRAYRNNRDLGDFNLLTIETTTGIMWGDAGIAQFFANENDVRQRDFSQIAYNWDCH